MKLLALLALAAVVLAYDAPVAYHGHKVLRITVKPGDLPALNQLDSRGWKLDWWRELPDKLLDRSVTADVRVAPEFEHQLKAFLAHHNIDYTVMIDDVEALAQLQKSPNAAAGTNADWFTAYHSYNDTVAWLNQLIPQYSAIAQIITVGTSYQGRTIYAVQITGAGNNQTKPHIFFDGGIHAREWISPITVQYVMNQLLTGYNQDPTVTKLVDNIVWTIIPIFNVDGYAYTWNGDRMWRKTRMPNKGSSCIGTDPCRNSPTGFGGPGSSSNPCADDYHGAKAFDQPEVLAVANFIKSLPNVKAYINFHSYSQLFMSPYGYTYSLPPQPDLGVQLQVGKDFVAAIHATHGVTYESGPVASTIYQASGVISDWVYAELHVVLSFACELRDTGQYGFLLPASQIKPTGEEIWAGMQGLANYVITH